MFIYKQFHKLTQGNCLQVYGFVMHSNCWYIFRCKKWVTTFIVHIGLISKAFVFTMCIEFMMGLIAQLLRVSLEFS